MSSFQPGDRVVCVDAVDKRWTQQMLVLGDVYVVDDVDDIMVVMNGVYYASERFVSIEVAQALGMLAGDVSKSEAEGQGFYSPDTQKLFLLLKASRDRVQQLLDKNNDYLEEARKARRETESLRLTLAAVEAQRDHLAAIVAAAVSGNLKETLDHLTKTVMGDTK